MIRKRVKTHTSPLHVNGSSDESSVTNFQHCDHACMVVLQLLSFGVVFGSRREVKWVSSGSSPLLGKRLLLHDYTIAFRRQQGEVWLGGDPSSDLSVLSQHARPRHFPYTAPVHFIFLQPVHQFATISVFLLPYLQYGTAVEQSSRNYPKSPCMYFHHLPFFSFFHPQDLARPGGRTLLSDTIPLAPDSLQTTRT